MGLDIYFQKNGESLDEIPSKKYPDHYFKIGYFRSSYNDTGINNILKNHGLPTLYDILSPPDSAGDFVPDWQDAKDKALNVIEQLKAKPNISCFEVAWNDLSDPRECAVDSKESAMAEYLNRISQGSFDSFLGKSGHFFKKGIKVFGLVHGFRQNIFQKLVPDSVVDKETACTFVICEGDNKWYIEALEIIVETVDYVLEQPDKELYSLYWSS